MGRLSGGVGGVIHLTMVNDASVTLASTGSSYLLLLLLPVLNHRHVDKGR